MVEAQVTVHDEEYQRAIAEYLRQLPVEVQGWLRTQMRLLLRDVTKFTPPLTLAQGRAAVARDINRALSIFGQTEAIRSPRLQQLIAARDTRGVQAILDRIPSMAGYQVNDRELSVIHESARDRRGRVRKKYKSLVLASPGELRTYVREVQGRVGLAKSGFARAYREVGGRVPNFVARHGESRGLFEDRSGRSDNPSLVAVNLAKSGQVLLEASNAGGNALDRAYRARALAVEGDLNYRLERLSKRVGG